jgi:hypothetical protein
MEPPHCHALIAGLQLLLLVLVRHASCGQKHALPAGSAVCTVIPG